MPFRVNAKTLFLTYPQAEGIESKEALKDFLETFWPTKVIVGREFHEDGGVHYHACVAFAERQDIRDCRRFDFSGCHPRIEAARSPKRSVAYCAKDGDYVVRGFAVEREAEDVFEVVTEEIQEGGRTTEVLGRILARTGTKGLRLYCNIERWVERTAKPVAMHQPMMGYPEEFRMRDVVVLGAVTAFIRDMEMGVGVRGERRSLWLWGPSRMGKTCMARSLGTHWYMNGQWNVECYDDAAQYGVLDDISWESLRFNYKGLLGLQQDVTVTDKYKKKSVIKGGKPVIVLSNELPIFTPDELLWMNANVTFVVVGQRLY